MGLSAGIYKIHPDEKYSPTCLLCTIDGDISIVYFDRCWPIHNWMFDLHNSKGGAKLDSTYFVVELTLSDLDALESFIDGLPSTKKEKYQINPDYYRGKISEARRVLLNEHTLWGQNFLVFYQGYY